MQVIKRDGTIVEFDKNKIENAILKAMKYGSGIYKPTVAKEIAIEAELDFEEENRTPSVYEIEDYVYFELLNCEEELTAKAYEGYRAVQEFKREVNTTDSSILGIISSVNEEVMNENSNKNAMLISTQRDLIAGEVSKDITNRKLIPSHIVQAHDDGVLHIHDRDYYLQPMFNCQLVNIQDMLDNGTVINGKMVESPKSFQTACTVLTQVIASVASSQFGGQSINIKHLGKYLSRTRRRYEKLLNNTIDNVEDMKKTINALVQKELEAGVQTIQYQIQTISSTNGQAPFVTLFMEIEDGHKYEEEISLIIEEMLKQRIIGVKNEKGVYTTPTFPKLIYVLDENNIHKNSKYRHITDIAIKCSAKRMYPDYISRKKMNEIYEGNCFSPMGCRAFLSPWKNDNGEYVFESRFNMGVVSINLPQIGIISRDTPEEFWAILDERLALCKEALMNKYKLLKGTISDVSPIHWQHGAIARLKKGQTIDHLLEGGFATISLGYIGIYEVTKLMTGNSHTTKEGKEFALKLLKKLKDTTEKWKKETGLGFALYGSPAENLTNRFCKIDRERFGIIKDITDKGFYINSFHVDTRETITAFDKLEFESVFQTISTGGAISYIEIPNMFKNFEALDEIIKFMYDNISYAEINTKSDYCHCCGFDMEILLNDKNEWYCPQCGNKDKNKMDVTRRTCGYLGANYWNEGRTKDIKSRVLHVD